MALGPYVPFEHWPSATRAAIAAAYTEKAAATAEHIRAQTPPATVPVSEAVRRDVAAHRELSAIAIWHGMRISELEALAPAELRPDDWRTVIPTDVLLRWATENLP